MATVARIAVFLCLIVLLQVIGPAHFATISNINKRDISEDDDEDIDDNEGSASEQKDFALEPQRPVIQGQSKRGIGFFKFASKLFGGMAKAGKALNIITSGASLFQAVFHAISKCCHTKACDYRNEFLTLKTQVEALTNQTDTMALRVENSQIYIRKSLDIFGDSIDTINRIGEAQLEFLESLSPGVRTALNTAGKEAQKYIDRMKAAQGEVKYLEVAKYYSSAMDTAVSIGVPLISTLMPAADALTGYSKKKTTAVKTNKLQRQNAIKLKSPKTPADLPEFKKSQRIGSVKAQLTKANTMKKTRMQKAKRFAGRVGKGFAVAFDFLTAGFNIYTMIKAEQQCIDMETQALKALNKMRETKALFDEGVKNLTIAEEDIAKAYNELYTGMTDETFTTNVQEIRDMLIHVASKSNENVELVSVAGKLQTFMTEVKNSEASRNLGEQETYKLINDNLLVPLNDVPFSLTCYISKNNAINDVLDGCQDGVKSLDELLEKNFGTSGLLSEKEAKCNQNIGEYINRGQVRELWAAKAKAKDLNEICKLNNKNYLSNVCLKKNNGQIAKQIAEDGVDPDAIQKIMDKCPAPEMSPNDKKTICEIKMIGQPVEKVASMSIFQAYPLSAVTEVYNNCPVKRKDKKHKSHGE
ncbi:uncharacterized protein LOC116614740 [Nematostella vectensis]|uniref:uncharacterized protein LOC116614740 n=1 Tax=Nematostella vectensis TaxID=45351 RepID=UPI00138FDD88|nr:uncharacterized protein LOC116614740 [Nematostella vectensis]XP_048587530.1 uncharacterized protein LOC116614740 [Nematostella vectensis]